MRIGFALLIISAYLSVTSCIRSDARTAGSLVGQEQASSAHESEYLPDPPIKAEAVDPSARSSSDQDGDYVEKWDDFKVRNTGNGDLILSAESYIIFVDPYHVKFRMNSNSPEQTGKFSQSPFSILLTLDPVDACERCPTEVEITRQSETDTEFVMKIFGTEQYFTPETTRSGKYDK